MSITRDRGVIVFEDDQCGKFLDTGTKDFSEARDLLKERGWITRKHDEKWNHFCSSECLKEFERPKGRVIDTTQGDDDDDEIPF